MQFIRKVYAILTMQILLTTALSSIGFFSDSYKTWIQSNQWMMWVSIFGAIGFMLLTYWKRKSYVSTQISSTHRLATNVLPSL
jgi:FtsH-binding integral membrane protein